MEKKNNVSLKEVLQSAAKDCVVPESIKDSVWSRIQAKMNESKVSEPQLFDGDYPAFDTDISELI